MWQQEAMTCRCVFVWLKQRRYEHLRSAFQAHKNWHEFIKQLAEVKLFLVGEIIADAWEADRTAGGASKLKFLFRLI